MFAQRQWAAAIEAFNPLLTPEDKYGGDWGGRATCFAELGRLKEAATDSARANALGPDYLPGAPKFATICLQVGDREKYLELCRHALDRQAESTDRATLNNPAWMCVLDPSAEGEAARALALVEKALDGTPDNDYLHTRACLLYRVGRYDEALEQLNELVARPGYAANAFDWLFLAMIHDRLGQGDQARKYLDRSIAWIASNPNQDWQRRAELEHFRAEAEALLGRRN